jgi:thiosulfate/3-mercaptopyruvate sulfurtransferase
MQKPHSVRYLLIAVALLLGVSWAFAAVETTKAPAYPNSLYLITADQLRQRSQVEPLVIIDVRNDKHFDGKMIPGAIRLPWSLFQQDSSATNIGGTFIGIADAQKILGQHGIFRNDKLVLYDAVSRDGGATASYLFWVLDLLGHKNMAILERGIDGWIDAGGAVVNSPEQREPLLYQAPAKEINTRKIADEAFISPRLGDPYYQLIDVRSAEEYLGKDLNSGLDGIPLKAGHIPGAYNINYESNWVNTQSKAIKSYAELAELYRGLDPDKAVIVYCHSGRRGSFGYFILRLMGFEDVQLYDNSWYGWGRPERYYPTETTPRQIPGQELPILGKKSPAESAGRKAKPAAATGQPSQEDTPDASADSTGGKKYISCGG